MTDRLFIFQQARRMKQGIVKNTGYRNTSIRFNIDHHISDNVKFGISTNYINTSANRGFSGNDNAGVTLGIALSSTPQFAQLHPDQYGNYPNNPFAASNPLQTVALMKNNEAVNRFITGHRIRCVLYRQSEKSITKFLGRRRI